MASEDEPSSQQAYYAIALGVKLRPGLTRRQLGELMQDAKSQLGGPPTREQIALAKDWQLEIPSNAKRRDLTDILYECILAQIWVMSVCRKIAGARWQRHADSGIPDEDVMRLARTLLQNSELFREVQSYAPESRLGADSWYRIGAKMMRADSFTFIAHLAERDLGRYL